MKWGMALVWGALVMAGALQAQTVITVPSEASPSKARLSPQQRAEIQSLQEEIRRIEQTARQQVEQLNQTAQTTTSDLLQRDIEQIKRETRLEVLRLRLRIAQIQANPSRIQEFSQAIERLEHPERSRKPLKTGPRPGSPDPQTR